MNYDPSIGSGGSGHSWMPSARKPFVNAATLKIAPKDTQQKLFVDVPHPTASLALDDAFADMIHCNALQFRLSDCPKFWIPIKLAKHVSTNYVTPSEQLCGNKLLKNNFDNLRKVEDRLLLIDAHIYGLQAYGDAATIAKIP